MQPRILIKGEMAIHGLRGDGSETQSLWNEFARRFAKKPFDKIGETFYEFRSYCGEKSARDGHDVLVGHKRALKNNADGYNCIVLPIGEYAVFDKTAADGNEAMERWLAQNSSSYARRELNDNNFILKCYTSENFKDKDKPESKVEIWIPISSRQSIMPKLLEDPSYSYISDCDRSFICAFDEVMQKYGYSAGNTIADGICWGRNMLIYRKIGVKSSSVAARIYMRDNGLCLRLFLNDVSRHGDYINSAPDFIKSVFTGEYGRCKRCKGDACKFRKDYEIDGVHYEKCNSMTFEFHEPTIEKLPEYMKLLAEFFPHR